MKLNNKEIDILLDFYEKLKELVNKTNSQLSTSKKPIGKGKTEISLTGNLIDSNGMVQEGIIIDCKGWIPE